MWTNPRYQDHLIAAIAWLTGQAMGDAKPNPEVSAKEDATAKKVAPKEEEKKGDAAPDRLLHHGLVLYLVSPFAHKHTTVPLFFVIGR
jgi:hypothetical protein